MPKGMTKQKQIEVEQRRVKVAEKVLAGVAYRDMATEFSVSLGTIAKDVKTVMKRYRAEQIEEYADIVQVELRRIDTALNAVWNKVIAGEKSAIETMILLQNQRAKYLALFEPEFDRIAFLFPSMNNDPDKQISVEEIRRKRWEQVYPQLLEVIDVEAKDVRTSTNLPDEPANAGTSKPDGGISTDSA
jgi:hypothetical protein